MSYEYILTFENEADMRSFVSEVSKNSLANARENNIYFKASDSNSQWPYDVRLVEFHQNKCLIQVTEKSEAIFSLFNSALLGRDFNIIEDADDEFIALEKVLKPSKAL